MDKPQPTDRPDAIRRALTLAALGVVGGGSALGLAGCGGDGHDDDNGRDPVAILRFANGTNVNPIDFRLNGQTVFTGLAAGGRVSTFGDVFPGNTVVAVRAPSGPPDLASVATTLVADRFTSVLAHGGLMGTAIELSVFEETNTQPAAGSTRIRIFHAASNIPGRLDVYFSALNETTLPATPTFSVGAYKGLSSFQALDSSAGYRIRIAAPGASTPLFDSGSASGVRFESRSVVMLAIFPATNGTDINLSALPEQSEGGQIGAVR